MRQVFSALVPGQAQAILAVVERYHPGRLDALRTDTLVELRTWRAEIRLWMDDPHSGWGPCSVDGEYNDETMPPSLHVGGASPREQAFTALHELGHHLQQQSDSDLRALLSLSDWNWSESAALEEEACDAFAARVLLPEPHLPDALRKAGPTAADVVALLSSSHASREACCVRASEFLLSRGLVVLLDAEGKVVFAARHGMMPPQRGSDQAATPLIRAALRSRGSAQVDRTHLVLHGGHPSEDLYGQATWLDENYLVAVLGVNQVAWRRFNPPRSDSSTSRFLSGRLCETCGEVVAVSGTCEMCQQPKFPYQCHCAAH
ncbi:ImmA/IrrE family metallo-endopeptidase [Actinacidiphila glaucinigra]|uniref:ImmA/IrrE family metallo-endopeptidase n=1 Tax=Actinacidiphila glaucinigra TaxID=235986 RepID=UPI00367063A0